MRKLALGLALGSGIAYGLRRVLGLGRTEAAPSGPGAFDDATLAHKVETEIFRDDDVPKGQINVNSQNGVVQLRGEVPSEEMLNALVERAHSVQGVRDVESLLHLPGAEPQMHQ